MNTKIISARVDEDIMQSIADIALQNNISKSELLRQFITQGIVNNFNPQSSNNTDKNKQEVVFDKQSKTRFLAYDKLFSQGKAEFFVISKKFKQLDTMYYAFLDYSELFVALSNSEGKTIERGDIAYINTVEKFINWLTIQLKEPFKKTNYVFDKINLKKQNRKITSLLNSFTLCNVSELQNYVEEFYNKLLLLAETREQELNEKRKAFFNNDSSLQPDFFDDETNTMVQINSKEKYLFYVKKYHPDFNKDPNATEKMQLLNNAWDIFKKYF